ncbi:hypothetical protein BDK51DRAFT_47527 [Blyttiomyces helicus]|uniref:Ion transport domain-containing protein n=1 Tax=Blyttiomyces helicus TaxID=388810 RepID=A0A4P9W111_9FUNG|nr:hypothetical protein BDK51DRAFT_47527 [Blyttiomyces helicus]|eukprot:RKO85861.1 hypothetical protein BDK51DRAFT_47527 [Blyttiomyces helicus]
MSVVLSAARLLLHLRIIPSVGPLIRIWITATTSVGPILVPMFIMALSFAGAFYLVQTPLNPTSMSPSHFSSIAQSLQSVLTMAAGDYSHGDGIHSVLDFAERPEIFTLRLLFHILFIIFLVNLIISLMTVHVADIRINSVAAWRAEIAALMVELELYWPWPIRYGIHTEIPAVVNMSVESLDLEKGRPIGRLRSVTRTPSRSGKLNAPKRTPSAKFVAEMKRQESAVAAEPPITDLDDDEDDEDEAKNLDAELDSRAVVLYTTPEEMAAKTRWWTSVVKDGTRGFAGLDNSPRKTLVRKDVVVLPTEMLKGRIFDPSATASPEQSVGGSFSAIADPARPPVLEAAGALASSLASALRGTDVQQRKDLRTRVSMSDQPTVLGRSTSFGKDAAAHESAASGHGGGNGAGSGAWSNLTSGLMTLDGPIDSGAKFDSGIPRPLPNGLEDADWTSSSSAMSADRPGAPFQRLIGRRMSRVDRGMALSSSMNSAGGFLAKAATDEAEGDVPGDDAGSAASRGLSVLAAQLTTLHTTVRTLEAVSHKDARLNRERTKRLEELLENRRKIDDVQAVEMAELKSDLKRLIDFLIPAQAPEGEEAGAGGNGAFLKSIQDMVASASASTLEPDPPRPNCSDASPLQLHILIPITKFPVRVSAAA